MDYIMVENGGKLIPLWVEWLEKPSKIWWFNHFAPTVCRSCG